MPPRQVLVHQPVGGVLVESLVRGLGEKSCAGLVRWSCARATVPPKSCKWAIACQVLCGGLVPPRLFGKSADLVPPRRPPRLLPGKSLVRVLVDWWVYCAKSCARLVRNFC